MDKGLEALLATLHLSRNDRDDAQRDWLLAVREEIENLLAADVVLRAP